MKTKEFMQTIDQHSDLPLLFQVAPGRVVRGGFHVTEIKNASYETVDCGNSLHAWREVVIQLWVPGEVEEDAEFMRGDKFRKIWDVVDSRIPLAEEGEIRIEYGDSQMLTSVYHVDRLNATEDGLIVELTPPVTMCKPRELLVPFMGDAAAAAANAASCCSPAITQAREGESVIPLEMVASNCC